ncbi:MAG: hypothetical protein AB7O37_16125 [Vicinamibacteria bacterium]
MNEAGETKRLVYRFGPPGAEPLEFVVELSENTLSARRRERESYPEWTALEFMKCPNCPLQASQHPRCPIAANLTEVVESFKDAQSFAEVDVEVEYQERRYSKRTSMQQALSSLIGVFMVTSGCPVLDKLRPMVDTHLPFMSPEESTYRTISMYLLAQYFRMRRGLRPDWELKDLVSFLEGCRLTNSAFVRRLQAVGVGDASLNALAMLNTLGEITSLTVDGDMRRLERLFMEHLRREAD